MALSARSIFLYGFEVTEFNSSLDFRAASLGPILQATLNLGFYSLTALGEEIVRAMQVVDTINLYSFTVDRTVNAGLENRVTIATNGAYLDLLFNTGPRTASTCATLIGFNVTDYTGATTYTGAFSAGTVLEPTFTGYNYIDVDQSRKIFGNVNVSTSGEKEAVVFQIQKFLEVQFKYEPKSRISTEWMPFMTWAIQQKLFEFTPEVTFPNTFYEVTLEKTPQDAKGLSYHFKEMLPDFPNVYDIGLLTLRQRAV